MTDSPGDCFICHLSLLEGKVVIVKQKGILTLIEASEKRGLRENKKFLLTRSEVPVHDACRKRYTAEKNIAASVRRGGDPVPPERPSPRPSLRQEHVTNLHKICFLCGEEITEEFLKRQVKLPAARKNPVHKVEKPSMKETIIDIAARRGDEWGQQIIDRLIREGTDLVAADARYHHRCHQNLYSLPRSLDKRPLMRPDVCNLPQAMEAIYSYLRENREECQFSLQELMDQITGEYVPDVRTVKANLIKHFGDKIVITESGQGKITLVCFRDVGQSILYKNWYEEKKTT